jgi:hypothetical protein
VASNDTMICEYKIPRDREEFNCSLIKVLSAITAVEIPLKIRTDYLPYRSSERYRYSSHLGIVVENGGGVEHLSMADIRHTSII